MANTITDNRTLLFNGGDGTGGAPDDLAGVATGTTDTSTFLQGSTSYTLSVSNSRVGMLYDAGTAQNWASNVFYFTVNCGVVGLMVAKASGGMTIRFCGATVTDWFEVYVGGNDSWPASIQGGWTNFVVDIDDARAAAVTNGWTNGTVPATSAIRYVGITTLLSTMPKMADNLWLDTIHRLPIGTAGILVQGRNGGTTDWNAADILTQLGSGQMAYRAGAGGAYVLSTPIQFGINDTSTHGFKDTDVIWLWDDQEYAPADLYLLSALGNSGGTTNVAFGNKSGTGAAATGSRGATISAASGGARWGMDFNDPDLDSIDLYGCSFIHGNEFRFDDIAVEVISSLIIDVTTVTGTNSDALLRDSYINANTAADNSALIWNENADVDGIVDGSRFVKGTNAHHAVELGLSSPLSVTFRDCDFSGFNALNAQNDSTFHVLRTIGTVTINIVGGSGNTTYKTAGALVNIVLNPVTAQVQVNDNEGNNLENARVYLKAANGTGPLPYQDSVTITRSATLATVAHTAHGMETGDLVVIKGITDKVEDNNGTHQITVLDANSYTYVTTASGSTAYTGTIVSTWVAINALTNASGIASRVKSYASNQPVSGRIVKSTSSPRFKAFPISGTIDSADGLNISAQMILDE